MEEFWVKMKNGIKDGAAFSATKIEQYSKIGKLKIEQFGLKKKVEGLQADLGVRLYDLIKEGKGATAEEDIAVISFIEKIDEHEAEIEKLTVEIEAIREETAEKQEAPEEESSVSVSEESEESDKSDEDEEEALGI